MSGSTITMCATLANPEAFDNVLQLSDQFAAKHVKVIQQPQGGIH